MIPTNTVSAFFLMAKDLFLRSWHSQNGMSDSLGLAWKVVQGANYGQGWNVSKTGAEMKLSIWCGTFYRQLSLFFLVICACFKVLWLKAWPSLEEVSSSCNRCEHSWSASRRWLHSCNQKWFYCIYSERSEFLNQWRELVLIKSAVIWKGPVIDFSLSKALIIPGAWINDRIRHFKHEDFHH